MQAPRSYTFPGIPAILPEGSFLPNNYNQTILKPINAALVDNPLIDTEYIILENIYNSSEQQLPLRQRDLAQIAGASLGMTNSILKRLAQKGWITVKKLNSRNIQYAITFEGMNEIIRRSYRYFKRTIKNVVFYKDILEDLVNRAKHRNISKVVLVGSSDLDFIVEHACRHCGLYFFRIPEEEKTGKSPLNETLKIYAENIPEANRGNEHAGNKDTLGQLNTFYLSRLIIKQGKSLMGSF